MNQKYRTNLSATPRKGKIHFLPRDIIALLLLTLASIAFFMRAPLGFGDFDEKIAAALIERIAKGDIMFYDEWSIVQTAASVVSLPWRIFLELNGGSSDGALLTFRYLFIFNQLFASVLIYCCLRRRGAMSIAASLLMFFFIPWQQFYISQNNLGLIFITAVGVLTVSAERFSRVRCLFIGFFTAIAVLACPALIFIYGAYTVFAVIFAVKKPDKLIGLSSPTLYFGRSTWLWVTAPAALLAVIMILRSIIGAGFADLIHNFPALFTDPLYIISGEVQNVFTPLESLATMFMMNFSLSPVLFILGVSAMLAVVFDKGRLKRRGTYIIILSVLYVLWIIKTVFNGNVGYYFTFPLPLCVFGLMCFILTRRRNKKAFVFLWILGILYAVCLDILSDMGYYSALFGLCMSCIGSVIFIDDLIREVLADKSAIVDTGKRLGVKRILLRVSAVALAAATPVLILSEIHADFDTHRVVYEYVCGMTDELDTELTEGPASGLVTTQKCAEQYEKFLRDFSVISKGMTQDDNVLIADLLPWGYLCLPTRQAVFSPTFLTEDGVAQAYISRLISYYELHRDRIPDRIYVPFSDMTLADLTKRADSTVRTLKEYMRFSVDVGEAGYILYVKDVNI